MKTLPLILAFALMGALVLISFSFEREEQRGEPIDLEIYTPENIYYINGFTVTNENDGETLKFENAGQLKEFISDRTADDTQKCADIFKN
jgi:hypothetical protein